MGTGGLCRKMRKQVWTRTFRILYTEWTLNIITVSDGQGNLNNVLRAPKHEEAALVDVEAEGDDDFEVGYAPSSDPCPMFSHECVEEGDGINVNGPPADPFPLLPHERDEDEGGVTEEDISIEYDPAFDIRDSESSPEPNYDDPRLELFPSNSRQAILAAMRKIETSTDEDRSVFSPYESAIVSPSASRSSSVADLASPLERLSRPKSNSSFTHLEKAPSLLSLQSISEDQEREEEEEFSPREVSPHGGLGPLTPPSDAGSPPAVILVGPKTPVVTLEEASDEEEEDEGIAMGIGKAKNDETSTLRHRKTTDNTTVIVPSADIRALGETSQDSNWALSFLRVVFVDWIGSFFWRILSGKQATVKS